MLTIHHLSIMRVLCFLCLLLAIVVAKKDLKKLQIGVKVPSCMSIVHLPDGGPFSVPHVIPLLQHKPEACTVKAANGDRVGECSA